MPVTAKLNYLRIAPRKVRLIANLIRGKTVNEAQSVLKFTVKKSTEPLLKLLNQAVINARNNFQLEADNLYVSKITVDEGPKLKRWRPRARGQAYEIQKKTSHITIVLDQISGKKKKVSKKKKPLTSGKSRAPVSQEGKKPDQAKEESDKKVFKTEKPKLRPETEKPKPKSRKNIKKLFRRKSF